MNKKEVTVASIPEIEGEDPREPHGFKRSLMSITISWKTLGPEPRGCLSQRC